MKKTFLFLILFIGYFSVDSSPVSIDPDTKSYNLSSDIFIFVDPDKQFTEEEILSGKHDDRFFKSDKKVPNFGINDSDFWVQFELKNLHSIPIDRILEFNYPLIDYINFYFQINSKDWKFIKTGDMTPFASRFVAHQNFLFPIHLEPKESIKIYMLIQSKGSVQIPMILWEQKAFIEDNHTKQILLGIYYGALFVMIIYNLFLFISIGDKSYFYYVIYILGFLGFQSSYNGYFFQFILPNSPILANYFMPFSIGFTLFFASQFTRSFLHTDTFAPRFDKLILGVMGLEFFVMILSPVLDYKTIVTIGTASTIPFAISIFIATFISLKNSYRPARYFALAWGVFLLGMSLLSLKQFGLLPANLITNYSIQLGSVIEVTLLSLGLGDRINLLIHEKKLAELEKLKSSQASKSIQDELNNARKIQSSLMPINIPQSQEIQIAIAYLPARQVGGDICGFHENSDKSLGIYIGDISGHGIPAALISLLIKQEFDYFSRKFISPKDTLVRVNRAVYNKIAGEFATFFYCFLEGNRILFSNAGHNPPILFRRNTGEVISLRTKGKPLGILPELHVEEMEVSFTLGDRLILFTDGLVEAGEEEMFGDERFQDFILQNKDLNAESFKIKLLQLLSDFTGQESFSDDLALMIIDKVK
jgi:two-component system, sensor histidine kinase LadS